MQSTILEKARQGHHSTFDAHAGPPGGSARCRNDTHLRGRRLALPARAADARHARCVVQLEGARVRVAVPVRLHAPHAVRRKHVHDDNVVAVVGRAAAGTGGAHEAHGAAVRRGAGEAALVVVRHGGKGLVKGGRERDGASGQRGARDRGLRGLVAAVDRERVVR